MKGLVEARGACILGFAMIGAEAGRRSGPNGDVRGHALDGAISWVRLAAPR